MTYRPGGSWLGRLGRSRVFAVIVSVTVHAIAFFVLYRIAFQEEITPKRVIIPEARLAAPSEPTTPRQERVELKVSRQAFQPLPQQALTSLEQLPPLTPDAAKPRPFQLPDDDTEIEPRSLSTIGMDTPEASLPVSTFFGRAGNAYKVVYVVDISESIMIYAKDIIRAELKRSIKALRPTQSFHIVVAAPLRVEEFGPRRLVRANRASKSEAYEFVERLGSKHEPGLAQPVQAMERAFAAGPELIYFLSDGEYQNVRVELEQRLKELNPDRSVKITVIGFGLGAVPRPDDPEAPRSLLERIARDHGGNYRAVDLDG